MSAFDRVIESCVTPRLILVRTQKRLGQSRALEAGSVELARAIPRTPYQGPCRGRGDQSPGPGLFRLDRRLLY